MNKIMKIALIPAAALVLAACSSSPSGADYDKITRQCQQNPRFRPKALRRWIACSRTRPTACAALPKWPASRWTTRP